MDRFTWSIAAGAVALVIAGLVTVLVMQRSPVPPDLSTPDGVVRAYLIAIDARKPEDAWELLGDRQKSTIPRDEFIRDVAAGHRPSRGGRAAIEGVTLTGDTARVDVSRTYTSDGGLFGIGGPSSYTNRSVALLERQNGRWRLTSPPEDYSFGRFPPTPIVVTATPDPLGTATATR